MVLLLVALNCACYFRTINGYFLADDMVHVSYLTRVFAGQPWLLWQNFVGNWMQTAGTQFYRPLISITLALDYLFYGANPIGFHLSNLGFQTLSSILLFLGARRMFPEIPISRRSWTALIAAALFACHPLHPEVVSWIIGRVDSLAAMFLLLSFWLYLKGSQQQERKSHSVMLRTGSAIAFVLSLMSKEMAITLPPALFLYALFSRQTSASRNLLSRAAKALWAVKEYFVILFVYIGVRTLALGTIAGGYAGSIGEGLNATIVKRWLMDGSLIRVLMPFNDEIFAPKDFFRKALKCIYGLSAALLIVRMALIARSRLPAKNGKEQSTELEQSQAVVSSASPSSLIVPLFALGWLVISLLPTIQVWNLTTHLQGSRFVYLATAPLCLLLASLISLPAALGLTLANGVGSSKFLSDRIAGKKIEIACHLLAVCLVAAYAAMAYKNNMPWDRASKSVRALRQGIEDTLGRLKADEMMVVTNLPQQYKGAHMLYNASTFAVLLEPPLSRRDISKQVATFEPVMFGDSSLINVSRLRNMLASRQRYKFFRWDETQNALVELNLEKPLTGSSDGTYGLDESAKADGGHGVSGSAKTNVGQAVAGSSASRAGASVAAPIIDTNVSGSDCLVSPNMNVNPLTIDFVDINLAIEPVDGSSPAGALILSWSSQSNPYPQEKSQLSLPLVPSTKRRHYRFCVSERKSWVFAGNIAKLRLDTTCKPSRLILHSIDVKSGDREIARLAPNPQLPNKARRYLTEDNTGVCRPGWDLGLFAYDVSRIPGAAAARYEVSQPDSWFEHYSGTFRDNQPSSHASIAGTFPDIQAAAKSIDISALPGPGFYELRIFALDKAGKVIGYSSDPINFQLSGADLRDAKRQKKERWK
ncbi:MAG TPA: glycosyltransferase family 39 protein [Candidatus Obscuribacterales bacterium]